MRIYYSLVAIFSTQKKIMPEKNLINYKNKSLGSSTSFVNELKNLYGF